MFHHLKPISNISCCDHEKVSEPAHPGEDMVEAKRCEHSLHSEAS